MTHRSVLLMPSGRWELRRRRRSLRDHEQGEPLSGPLAGADRAVWLSARSRTGLDGTSRQRVGSPI